MASTCIEDRGVSFKMPSVTQVIRLKDTDQPTTAKAVFGNSILEWLDYY